MASKGTADSNAVATTIVLITGANRGLGHALAATYLLRPSHIVIGTARDPSTYAALTSLPTHPTSRIITTTLDAASESSNKAAIADIQASHGITSLDLVYANAGISRTYPNAAEASLDDIRAHIETNALGSLALFQATLALLQKSSAAGGAKFVAMSSSAASIGGMELRNVPNAAYGTSKAALNYLVRKMHFENEGLVVLAVDPGWVQTEMGNKAAWGWGLEKAETTIEASVNGVVKAVDGATRENGSGKFLLFSGGDWPW